jgi:hypothetical protein
MNKSKYQQRAEKYFVEDIPAALLPGSRLYNILERLESGHPIPISEQDFLRSKGLSALSIYANSLSFFVKDAGFERAERYRASTTISQENERKLQEEARQARLTRERYQAEAERKQREEAERKRRDREVLEAQQAKRIAEKRTEKTDEERIKKKYGVSMSILKANFPDIFNAETKIKEGANSCIKTKEQGLAEKRKATEEEIRLFKIKLQQDATMEKARVAAGLPPFVKPLSSMVIDCAAIKRKAQDALMEKYSIYNWRRSIHFDKLIDILQRLDSGCRLPEVEFAWIKTTEKQIETIEKGIEFKPLKKLYHKKEAAFYAEEFKDKKDCWLAVNASSHYRKCDEAHTAEVLLNTINISSIKDTKLKSALCTTHGGVKRNLGDWKKALHLGEQAHLLTPKDFRPCTLLGAVNMEIGNYDLGRSWYDKAIERGYSERAMDDELRSIFMRAEKSRQDEMGEYLLKIDPVRYSWAKKKQTSAKKKIREAARTATS